MIGVFYRLYICYNRIVREDNQIFISPKTLLNLIPPCGKVFTNTRTTTPFVNQKTSAFNLLLNLSL